MKIPESFRLKKDLEGSIRKMIEKKPAILKFGKYENGYWGGITIKSYGFENDVFANARFYIEISGKQYPARIAMREKDDYAFEIKNGDLTLVETDPMLISSIIEFFNKDHKHKMATLKERERVMEESAEDVYRNLIRVFGGDR